MKRYCSSCGVPTEYSLKKPNFCSNCGTPFEKQNKLDQILSSTPNQIIENKNLKNEIDFEIEDDNLIDGEDVRSVPKISSLEIETSSQRQRGEKLKDILRAPSPRAKRVNQKNKHQKISSKKILEDFRKEAGALRPKNR